MKGARRVVFGRPLPFGSSFYWSRGVWGKIALLASNLGGQVASMAHFGLDVGRVYWKEWGVVLRWQIGGRFGGYFAMGLGL